MDTRRTEPRGSGEVCHLPCCGSCRICDGLPHLSRREEASVVKQTLVARSLLSVVHPNLLGFVLGLGPAKSLNISSLANRLALHFVRVQTGFDSSPFADAKKEPPVIRR